MIRTLRQQTRTPVSVKKSAGSAAKLGSLGHVLTENRDGIVVDAWLTLATGTADREAALAMLSDLPNRSRVTLGADKGYNAGEFVTELRELNSWWKKGAPRALGRSRGGLRTKIHLRTDSVENPLAYTITTDGEYDASQLINLSTLQKIKRVGRGRPRLRPDFLAGDKGYDGSQLRAVLGQRGLTPVIPARSTRKRTVMLDRERYRSERIERCFNRLKQ